MLEFVGHFWPTYHPSPASHEIYVQSIPLFENLWKRMVQPIGCYNSDMILPRTHGVTIVFTEALEAKSKLSLLRNAHRYMWRSGAKTKNICRFPSHILVLFVNQINLGICFCVLLDESALTISQNHEITARCTYPDSSYECQLGCRCAHPEKTSVLWVWWIETVSVLLCQYFSVQAWSA